MLAFIPVITVLLFLSTAGAASTKKNDKPDPTIQQCGRSYGEFANLGTDRLACKNYASVHYSCAKDSCGVGQAPAAGTKSTNPYPTFQGCQKYTGAFGDDTKLDPTKVNIMAVSYFFDYKDKWLRVYGYDAAAARPAGDLPGYSCPMPAKAPQVIEVCRDCQVAKGATW